MKKTLLKSLLIFFIGCTGNFFVGDPSRPGSYIGYGIALWLLSVFAGFAFAMLSNRKEGQGRSVWKRTTDIGLVVALLFFVLFVLDWFRKG